MYDKQAYISKEAAMELKWWESNIMAADAPIKRSPVDFVIYSDASLEGWGCTDQNCDIGGRWDSIEAMCHINALELFAAFLCLQSYVKKDPCNGKNGQHYSSRLHKSQRWYAIKCL